MSLLTDTIDQMGAATALAMIRALPYWKYLSEAVKSAKDIYHVVNTLGFQTKEDLESWLHACHSGPVPQVDLWLSLVNPKCSVKASDLQTVTWAELDGARDLQCNTAPDYHRMNSDRVYLIGTEAQLRTFSKEDVSWRYENTGHEISDCDDLVNISRGWKSAHGIGNYAEGKAGTRHFRESVLMYGHAVTLAYSRENGTAPIIAWWKEPQTGEVHPVSKTDLGDPSGYAWTKPDRVEIAWGDF